MGKEIWDRLFAESPPILSHLHCANPEAQRKYDRMIAEGTGPLICRYVGPDEDCNESDEEEEPDED
jgi:hypothetical protein